MLTREELIKRAAHCFRTDEKSIEKFMHDFFSASDIDAATKVMDNFLDAHVHSTTPEELDDFCSFIDLHRDKYDNGII